MSDGVRGVARQAVTAQQLDSNGAPFNFPSALQDETPRLSLPNTATPSQQIFRNPVTTDPSGGLVYRLPAQLQQQLGVPEQQDPMGGFPSPGGIPPFLRGLFR